MTSARTAIPRRQSTNFLTNMGVFGSSRSSVSSDRSHSSEDYSASIQEDKDQHILLTFHKDDIDPVNKGQKFESYPPGFCGALTTNPFYIDWLIDWLIFRRLFGRLIDWLIAYVFHFADTTCFSPTRPALVIPRLTVPRGRSRGLIARSRGRLHNRRRGFRWRWPVTLENVFWMSLRCRHHFSVPMNFIPRSHSTFKN